MKKGKRFSKGIVFVCFLLVFVVSLNFIPAFASSSSKSTDPPSNSASILKGNNKDAEKVKVFNKSAIFKSDSKVKKFKSSNGVNVEETVVTDKATIMQIAADNDFANPDTISEITVGVFDEPSVSDSNPLSFLDPCVEAQAATTYSIYNQVYQGNNYYFANQGTPYIVQNNLSSTATLHQNISCTGTVSFSCSVEAGIGPIVKAKCGMDIGTSHTYGCSLDVPVPGRSYVTVTAYSFLTMYTYSVNLNGVYYTSGSYWWPNGGVYYIIK